MGLLILSSPIVIRNETMLATGLASNCLYFGGFGLISQRNLKLASVLHPLDVKWKRRTNQK